MFSISTNRIDLAYLSASLRDSSAGAMSTFEGWVRNRNDGRDVLKLEYEAHEPLAVKEAERIIDEAKKRFGVLGAVCVHRVGLLDIGDLAVWVGVTAVHRAEAFAACRYIIDEVKARLPIWKKEHYVDRSAEWVNCQTCTSDHLDSGGTQQALADLSSCDSGAQHGGDPTVDCPELNFDEANGVYSLKGGIGSIRSKFVESRSS